MAVRDPTTHLGQLPGDLFDAYFTHGYLAGTIGRIRGKVNSVKMVEGEDCVQFDIYEDNIVILTKDRVLSYYCISENRKLWSCAISPSLTVTGIKIVEKNIQLLHTTGSNIYSGDCKMKVEIQDSWYGSVLLSGWSKATVFYSHEGKRIDTYTSYGKCFGAGVPGGRDNAPADFGLKHLGINYNGDTVALVNDKVYTKDRQTLSWQQVEGLVVDSTCHSPSFDNERNIVILNDHGMIIYDNDTKTTRQLPIKASSRTVISGSRIYFLDASGELKVVS